MRARDGFEDLVVEDVDDDEGLIADGPLELLDESVDGFVFVEDDCSYLLGSVTFAAPTMQSLFVSLT